MRLSTSTFPCLLALSWQVGSVHGLAGREIPTGRTTSSFLSDRRALLTGLVTSATAAATLGWVGRKPAVALEADSLPSLAVVSTELQDVYFGVSNYCSGELLCVGSLTTTLTFLFILDFP